MTNSSSAEKFHSLSERAPSSVGSNAGSVNGLHNPVQIANGPKIIKVKKESQVDDVDEFSDDERENSNFGRKPSFEEPSVYRSEGIEKSGVYQNLRFGFVGILTCHLKKFLTNQLIFFLFKNLSVTYFFFLTRKKQNSG